MNLIRIFIFSPNLEEIKSQKNYLKILKKMDIHISNLQQMRNLNSVLIASKYKFIQIKTPNLPITESNRLTAIKIFGIVFIGVYFAQKKKKRLFFNIY